MSYRKKILDYFTCKPVREIKFPKLTAFTLTSDKKEKAMNNLVIKPDKNTIYQISKDDIQELKHIPEGDVAGFAMCPTMNISDIHTPIWHYKEEYYVILKNGKRIDLTKKQYNTIKGWFKGENK